MQNSKTCNTFFSHTNVYNQLVKFHSDNLYFKILPYSPTVSRLNLLWDEVVYPTVQLSTLSMLNIFTQYWLKIVSLSKHTQHSLIYCLSPLQLKESPLPYWFVVCSTPLLSFCPYNPMPLEFPEWSSAQNSTYTVNSKFYYSQGGLSWFISITSLFKLQLYVMSLIM